MTELNQKALKLAAADFLYLLDRGYSRSASLQLVGNRYTLDRLHREVLHRGVFAREEAKQRCKRLVGPEELVDRKLVVDGHNVIITTESRFAGRPLIAANDGLIRDVAGISHRYRISSQTHDAIENLLQFLHKYPPRETLFYLDAPIRQSGELAAKIRAELKSWNLPGDAQAKKVPEKRLIGAQGIVASSDSAVLDEVKQSFDLAGAVIKSLSQKSNLIDFTSLGSGALGQSSILSLFTLCAM
ncbi:MAG: DUF434 domain-containing protein [Deltaproteobacteria bacterium]|nr:DUF434 domain-containing protein [Deltaproteobacteria bacterium]